MWTTYLLGSPFPHLSTLILFVFVVKTHRRIAQREKQSNELDLDGNTGVEKMMDYGTCLGVNASNRFAQPLGETSVVSFLFSLSLVTVSSAALPSFFFQSLKTRKIETPDKSIYKYEMGEDLKLGVSKNRLK